MYTDIKNVKIAGISAAVSGKWDSLLEISDEDEAIIRKFIKKTGVEGRYSASPRQTTSDFCFAAAEKLLNDKQIDRSQIGVLVFVTQTSDYRIPATACLLQDRLGLDKSCIGFDVNLGCSGFTYGVQIAASLLAASQTKYALLLAGDTSAREYTPKEKSKTSHSASMLFGDSGTATLIEKCADSDIIVSAHTDGSGYKAIIAPYRGWRNPVVPEGINPGSTMDDIAVFNFATSAAPAQINDYMEQMGTTSENYDCLVLHQANMMIMKRIAKKTGFPEEKMLVSMNKFGNTSSASIPITLVDKYGDVNEEKTVNALCCGFGVGLSWATAALEINTKDILPLVHTDEYFKDGYNVDDQK